MEHILSQKIVFQDIRFLKLEILEHENRVPRYGSAGVINDGGKRHQWQGPTSSVLGGRSRWNVHPQHAPSIYILKKKEKKPSGLGTGFLRIECLICEMTYIDSKLPGTMYSGVWNGHPAIWTPGNLESCSRIYHLVRIYEMNLSMNPVSIFWNGIFRGSTSASKKKMENMLF